ncbi:MAG: GGDEF domain-containing protein [Neomegalonema sp.]|nr:GGDEF domain-containing protein [Neomegalonema sp.]
MRGVEELGFSDAHSVLDYASSQHVLHEIELLQVEKAIAAYKSRSLLRSGLLFLNVDGRILNRPEGFVEKLRAMLARHGVSETSVALELSERHDRTANAEVSKFIEKARSAGFVIAIDDVGVGVADLQALAQHRFDYVKIDRYFVDGVGGDARLRFFVATLVELAHMLGAKVIIEGVENEADYFACRDIGCDYAQGFLIGRPTTVFDDISPKASVPPQRADQLLRRDDDRSEIEAALTPIPALVCGSPMSQAIARLADPNAPNIIPIVDADKRPIGQIHFEELRSFLASPYGLSLLRNDAVGLTVNNFFKPCHHLEVDVDVDKMIAYCAGEGDGSSGLVLTKNGYYYGFITTISLLSVANSRRIQQARDENPLTRLPGNRRVNAFLDHARASVDVSSTLVYFDFDHFKPFNDYFGFRIGDRAILMFASLLRKSCRSNNMTIGHIGGDDFFLGCRSMPPETAVRFVRDLTERFALGAESFYNSDERQNGYIETVSRDGEALRAPLLQVSAALLHFEAGVAPTEEDLTVRMARLKKIAKSRKDNFVAQVIRRERLFEDGETFQDVKVLSEFREA